ncbi:hypothetical protein H6P81_013286 [Aristolochia fimbriata]|uniref:Aluminum-activated malate transporter n=1 Tax=Aristolochia fimbriata TaxID=158543 RepID=A0AAV7EEA6_ARIFI|nr:hypothetical protein H6P81_013286 [Aristolochia fimbriata]
MLSINSLQGSVCDISERKIMAEPATSSPYKRTQSSGTRGRQCRLLQTCAITFLTMAGKAFGKVEELRWPVGASARNVATIAGPLVYIIQCQWLVILSLVDDQISTVENVAESLFPPSALLFDKIESLVDATESLPGKLDHAFVDVDATIRRAAALNPLLNMAIDVLDHLINCALADPRCREAKEKDIAVDERCSFASKSEETMEETKIEQQPETLKSEIQIKEVSSDPVEVSTEKGKEKEKKKKENKGAKKRVADIVPPKEQDIEEVQKKELIMDLFESGWGI